MIKAVIFDMDGVIVDSETCHLKIEKELFEKYNIKVDETYWKSLIGTTTEYFFTKIVEKYNVKSPTAKKLSAEKRKLFKKKSPSELKLFTGFLNLIKFLKSNSYKIALTTSSNKDIQDLVFNKFNLYPHFEQIVTGDMVTNGKPDPEPYALTIKKLNLNPEDCLVIEDSDNGILAANSAGAKTIGITSSLPRERLQAANFIVDKLKEVELILKEGKI